MAEAERVLRELARAGMTREDHVVALGGGVVGDLAGFCAHLYQRGVPVVQVPTTLVAQVDSAYGGKTGVDLPEGKNYAGAYHLPAAVIADTGDAGDAARGGAGGRLRRGAEDGPAGRRRALGAGAGGRRASNPRELDDVVFACARYKCEVVAADERDAGLRHVAQPRPHGRPRDRGGERLRRATATARRSGSACWRRCASPTRRSCASEVEAILRRHDLPVRLDADDRRSTRSSTRSSATRSAPPPASASSSSPSPGSPAVGQLVDPARVRGAVEELLG